MLAAVCLLATPAPASPAPPAIVGGSPASPGEYPAQGWLVADLDGIPGFDSECGGSLVASRWLLTAAHCVAGGTAFQVLLGDNDLAEPNADWYGVVAVDVHADWNPLTNQNDVAMLKLSRPAPYQRLRVIGPNESASWAPGVFARIIGWGSTSEDGPPSDLLLEADVPIVADMSCAAAYVVNVPPMDPNRMLCAGDGAHDTCQGDSGGPLIVRDGAGNWALAGIASWGRGCARAAYPGVYTRLGAPALNAWVMARYPRPSFTVGAAHSGAPTTLTSTAFHPEPNGFTSFRWDLNGDGIYAEGGGGPTAVWVFADGGPHEVGLLASSAPGEQEVVRQVVNVNWSPTAEGGGPYRVREGGSTNLTASGSDREGQALTYRWDLDGDLTFETPTAGARFSAARIDGPRTPVRLLIDVQVCDSAGACDSDRAEIVLSNAPPRARAGPDRRARAGRRLCFRGRASDPSVLDRLRTRWRFGDGAKGQGLRPCHTYRKPGRYTAVMSVRDDDGGLGVDKVRVRVRR